MTPPDAMSWDEAVVIIDAASRALIKHNLFGIGGNIAAALAAIQSHRVQADLMAHALKAVKIRLHFDGMPGESMWNAGTDDSPRWTSDWRHEIALIEQALHGTPYTPPSALEKVRRRCEVSVQAEDAHKGALAALVASVSLLERGGKKAAPSNHMFQMMIADYKKAIDISRVALAAAANNDGGSRE